MEAQGITERGVCFIQMSVLLHLLNLVKVLFYFVRHCVKKKLFLPDGIFLFVWCM